MLGQAAVAERRARWRPASLPLLALLLGSTPASPGEPPRLEVAVHAGRVSVTARGASLADVLAEIGRQGGFPIGLDAALEARVAHETTTVTLRDLTPERALRQILGAANLVFVYARDELTAVQAYENGAGAGRPAIEVVRPAAIVKPGAVAKGTAAAAPRPGPLDTTPVRLDPARLEAQVLTAADPAVRWRALEGLSEVGDPVLASRTASRVLGQERDGEVLERALTVLSGDESAPLEPLLRFAASPGHADLRVRALQMLAGRAEDDVRVGALLARLARSDRSADVRESAKGLLDDRRRSLGAL